VYVVVFGSGRPRQSILHIGYPALLEHGHNSRAARRENLLEVALDLMLLHLIYRHPSASADPGSDRGRSQ
jgi:hypothetical protein